METRLIRAALLVACASVAPVSTPAQGPPDVAVTPASFSETLASGDQVTRTLTIANQGGSDLTWRLTAGSNTLESVLTSLDAGFPSIVAAIPSRYAFTEGETGDHIEDGGANMYDGGNFLRTERGGPLAYSNGTIVGSSALGPSGRYFTRKYPGLFVLAADLDDVQQFTIDGDLGANGGGAVDTTVTQYQVGSVLYLGFVKRVHGAIAPSVNHMILVEESASLLPEFSTSTNSDFHRLSGLSGTRRLYYLLYAGEGGAYLDDEAASRIMQAFLDTLGASWLRAEPGQGTIPPGGSDDVTLTFDAAGLFGGGYDSTLVVSTDDPDEPSVSVPVHLQVTGVPELDVFPTSLNFGSIFVDGSDTQEVSVRNAGTDTLTIASVSSDHPAFTAGETEFTVAAGQTRALAVTFAPDAAGPAQGTLTLVSDDADEPEVTVALHGTGLLAPDIGVAPASFEESLVTGETVSRTLTVANTGGATLSWSLTSAGAGSSTLEDVLERLEEGAGSILDAIPGRYLFSEGEFDNSIGDGGGDMYDGGNRLWTDLGGPVDYTNGPIVDSPVFGATGRYFTRKFPGLFVLAADLSGPAEFRIEGNLGADGFGSVDGAVLEQTVAGVRYRAFVKRVYAAFDPSVNHLIVVEDRPGLEHQFPSNTDDDFHRVFDLSGSTRLYYLLYAGTGGRYIDDVETRSILAAFLATLGPRWLTVSPHEGALPPGGEATIAVGIDAAGLIGGDYDAEIGVTSNDPDESQVTVPVHLHVTGAADVDVAPLSLDFGSIFVGSTSSRTATVRNLGTDVLHVSGVAFDHGDFAVDAATFSLAVGETRTLALTFTPTAVGSTAATMTLVSDDPDEPAVQVSLQGVGLIPPEVAVSPASFSESLFTGQSVTRELILENTGGSPLEFEIFLRTATLAGSYGGTHLAFGISDYGEVMPFQSPPGVEHLQWGTFLSGHTLAYVAGGQDRTCFAVYADRDCFVPESYREVRNTPSTLEVEVASRTGDGSLRLLQTFTFQKATRYVILKTRVTNMLAADVSNVVLKWVTDWDVGGAFENTWDYDRDRNAVLAWEGSYVAVAGVEAPAQMDLYGWDDYTRRLTLVDYPTGPAIVDGAGLLHFELGLLPPGASRQVTVVYAAGPDLETLRQAIDAGRGAAQWIDLDVVSGTVPAGTSRSIAVTFDANGLIGGDYDADIVVATNDPDEPELAVPAHLQVTGAPDLDVTPPSIDFGDVFVGGTASRTVQVTNTGTDLLTVSAVTLDHAQFATDTTSFTLAVGVTRTMTVTFAPGSVGPASATLVFTSDDPDQPTLGVALQGHALDAPELGLTPLSFSESLLTGETVTRTLTIGNRGGSDLTFSIAVASTASAGLRPVPPPPAGMATGPRYDQGGTPARPPQVHAAPPAGPGLGSFPVLLIQAGGDPSDIRQRLLEFPDITAVDVFDAVAGTPTMDNLLAYRAVLVADNNPFANPVGLGNVLADYVDAGGGVVLVLASFVDIWSLQGRFMDEGYSPFGVGTGPFGSATLGTYDATHPIMSGVTSVTGDLLASAPLTPGATVVASWSNGLRFVATQGDSVAAVNVFTATPGFWSGDVPLILHNALFWAAEVDWLSAAPLSGVVPPGETRDIVLTFDATGLNGGDYDAAVVVTTNDPHQPEKRVLAALHVTGAPDVEVTPPSVDFGTVFVGASALRAVTVTNRGTDVLTVSGITVDDGDFAVDGGSFTLNPRQSRSVQVTWSPGAPGSAAATMTVASDDPDEPQASVSLLGQAVIAPDVGVSPTSLAESLFTGETVTRTLTLENTGGSELTFEVALSDAPARTGARALLLQDTAPWGSSANQVVLQAAGIPFDMVGSSGLPGVNLSLYRHVIVASDQPTSFYQVFAANRSRIEAWVNAGGVLEFHAAGWGSQGGEASLVTLPGGMHILQRYASENLVLLPGHPLVEGVASPVLGTYASHASFTDVPLGATLVVSDDTGAPNLVVYRFGAGTVVAGGQTFEFQFPVWGAGRILQNMIPWANGRLDWLSVDTTAGTVPAGGSASVAVTLDAEGLVGGDYLASVVVTSNDPDEPELAVPVHLRVTGAPDLEVSPAALAFDPIFVGGTATKPLTVTNAGTDVLTVSAVTLDHPSFTADASSFTLAAGASRTLMVTYAPTAPEVAGAVLVLASDDPDQPEVSVPLHGVALIAPDIAVSPASFSESLLTGQTVTRALTVENTGGSDLTFEVSVGEAPARSGGVRTLLVQDSPPWSTTANQTVLHAFGIPFDVRGSASLESLNLSLYDHMIVAADQTTDFYQVFADNRGRIDAWVGAGGVLEFHAAGWGWASGNASLVTLPAGMHIELNVVDENLLLMADHPLVAGVPNPMVENEVSIASFADVPAGASIVAADAFDRPTLVVYRFGAGHVVASGHPLEFAFPSRLESLILVNMIPWADRLQSWLAVAPAGGTVPPGGSATLSVLFDATGLVGGDYAASVVVTSNDPDETALTVPAALHVTGAPDIGVSPGSLNFGTIFLGEAATGTLQVTNDGTDTLTVSGLTFDHPDFSADAGGFSLGAGESRTVTVTYAPSAPGSVAATLLLASDDPDQPTTVVDLTGSAVTPADIAVDPLSIQETVLPGTVTTRTLTLTNMGDTDLTFLIHSPATALGETSVLLVTANADVAGLRQELADLEGLGAVDVFDATFATPSLAELAPYATVVLISGLQPFADPAALGNALADYVDGGGGVILTFSSFVAGWEVSGRFGAGYAPFTLGVTLLDSRPLGDHDAGHPIFLGVSSVIGFPTDVGLAPGAQLVAEWEGGLPFVATQGSSVVGVNIYVASPFTWQGQVAALIRNAALWTTGRQGAWLSVVPRAGVLPGRASVPITLTLDASQLDLGEYSSPLIIESNDGDKPSLIVPLTLTVASCVPATESCNGVDDDCDGQVDEDLETLTCGVGACAHTVEACVSGVPQVCTPGQPTDEFCNGIDDDCNGVADDYGDTLCDDGDPCTSDTCRLGAGCFHEISGGCHASPRGQGFWRRLCSGPHPEGEITQTDVDCVNETCTFAPVQSVADLCARLTPSPSGDKCEQAEAQLMALTLNHCQGRVADTAPILSACSASTTVGQSRTEVDALLCPPWRDDGACSLAQCQAEEINSGRALQANSLRLRRLLDGSIRLAWAPPYSDVEVGPPDVYRVRRRTGNEAPFENLSETTELFYVDPDAGALPAAQYEVTPIWK